MRTRSVVVGGRVGKSSHDSHMAPATTEKMIWMIRNGVKRQVYSHEVPKYLKDEWTFFAPPRVKK